MTQVSAGRRPKVTGVALTTNNERGTSVIRVRRLACMTMVPAGASVAFAAPAYADVGGGPAGYGSLLVVVVGAVCVLVVGTVSWFVLRGVTKRRRERRLDREAAEQWARLKAQEQEEPR
jgi:hypothetical protein